jgi:hypothetical protein
MYLNINFFYNYYYYNYKMPVYSISRTSQYTTVAALETKANQDGFSWNGFDLDGYVTNFIVNFTTVCPTANRLWNYSNAISPSASYVWYPYSITIAVSGGNPYQYPNGPAGGQRPGIAYTKLYDSLGNYLMGSYTNNTLETAGSSTIFITTGPAIQATTHTIINSRNTLTLTANTTYYAGFAAPTTSTAFWNIFSRTTGQTGQNVYIQEFSNTVNAGTGNLPSSTITHSSQSLMGFITYNASPPQPTNLVITTTNTGITITCRSNEAQSIATGSIGAVSRIRFFYSLTLLGTYNYLGIDTSITRTLISGTTYQYTATFEGGTTLTQGRKYFFKVATMNDVCIAYQTENTSSIPASQQSTAVEAQYGNGNILNIRNSSNSSWIKTDFKVRNLSNNNWSNASVAIRDATNSFWVYN